MKKFKYSKNDFSQSSLPVNRKELFFDVYRNNMKTITKCGLSLFVFALPMLAFMIFMFFGYIGITKDNFGDQHDLMLLIWNIVTPLGFLVLFIPILVCISGVIRVLRQLVWQEGIDFGSLSTLNRFFTPSIPFFSKASL